MRVYRCFAPGDHQPGEVVALDREESRHLGAVRRVSTGHPVALLNGNGAEFSAEVESLSRDKVTLRILSQTRHQLPPTPLAIAWGLTKSSAFDDNFQRAIELGMTDFVPLHAERCEVSWEGDRWEKKRERYEKLAIESLKQCERLWLPRLHSPQTTESTLRLAEDQGWTAVMLHERDDATALWEMPLPPQRGVVMMIGPEGGWTPDEGTLARGRALFAHLGREGILRTGTAALAGLAVLLRR